MSKIFKKGNWNLGHICPICGTQEDKEVVLIPIFNTIKDGNAEAAQIHLDCLLDNLVIGNNVIVSFPLKHKYQKVE